jgi:hypothetical protein
LIGSHSPPALVAFSCPSVALPMMNQDEQDELAVQNRYAKTFKFFKKDVITYQATVLANNGN